MLNMNATASSEATISETSLPALVPAEEGGGVSTLSGDSMFVPRWKQTSHSRWEQSTVWHDGGRIGHTNCDRQYVRVFSFPLLGRKSSFMFSRSDDRRVVKSCHGNRSSSAVKLRGSGQADLERNNRTRNDLVSSLERSWLVKFRTTKKTRARTKQWVEQKKRGCFLMFDVFLFKQQKQPWGIARARAERERERDRDSFRWSVWKKIKTIFFSSSSP